MTQYSINCFNCPLFQVSLLIIILLIILFLINSSTVRLTVWYHQHSALSTVSTKMKSPAIATLLCVLLFSVLISVTPAYFFSLRIFINVFRFLTPRARLPLPAPVRMISLFLWSPELQSLSPLLWRSPELSQSPRVPLRMIRVEAGPGPPTPPLWSRMMSPM